LGYLDKGTGWTIRGWNPGKSKRFFSRQSVSTGSGAHPASYLIVTAVILWGQRGRAVVLNTEYPSTLVKNGWSHTSSPPMYLHGVDRDNL